MDKVLVFDLMGPMAHFRKYYTNSSAMTYGFPPRTVLMGMVAAVLGCERDSYYEDLDKGRFAVVAKTPARRLVQTVNYLRTKKEDLLEIRRLGRVPGTQTPLEFLLPDSAHNALRFRVFFAHPDADLLTEVARRVRENRSYYPLYLGLTECLASAACVKLAGPGEYEVLPPSGPVTVTSVLNAAHLREIVLDKAGTSRLVRERAPYSFGPGRVLRPPCSVVYEAGARPITARLHVPAYRFSLVDEETVVFLEG